MTISDQQFAAFADNLPTLCWMANPDGFIFWYNRRWYDYTGLTPAQIEGWGWQSAHDPEALPGVLDLWTKSIATGAPFEMTFPLKGADGFFRPFLTRIVPYTDQSGTIMAWFGVNIDVSEQVDAERALRYSEAQFRMFAQAMPNHVWSAKPDGMLDWFNDQVYRYNGVSPGELDGEDWARMVHADDIGATAERWAASLSSGKVYENEFRLRRYDGVYRWHLARAVPIHGADGKITRWIGTNTDIEDQKNTTDALAHLNETLEDKVKERTAELVRTQAALRQSQKMEAIGNLTGGVAHDFNNLLQVISGNLQLLARDVAGNEKAEQRIQNAMSGVSRGAKLASQLLSFGRRQALAPKVLNIGRFIRDMDDLMRRTLGEEIEIETIVAGGLWNTMVDPGNIENAILNLAINARDAMHGQGKLTIEASNAFLDDDYVKANGDASAGQYVLLAGDGYWSRDDTRRS